MATATHKKTSRRDLLEGQRLLTCPEVDYLYRLQEGTARKAAAAGLVPSSQRRWGADRMTYLIAPSDAHDQWGPK